jgi:hypothetical protein
MPCPNDAFAERPSSIVNDHADVLRKVSEFGRSRRTNEAMAGARQAHSDNKLPRDFRRSSAMSGVHSHVCVPQAAALLLLFSVVRMQAYEQFL